MITESEIARRIGRGGPLFPPFTWLVLSSPLQEREDRGYDLKLEARRGSERYRFLAEIKRLATPRIFREALAQVRVTAAREGRAYPLLIVPYLPEERLKELEEEGVSGIDLSGNGVVIIPGKILICRSGQPNRFPNSALIRNVYRGRSSIVARAFFTQAVYPSVGAIYDLIQNRGVALSLPTVSKSLKQLKEDLVVGRDSGRIRLLQPEKLLERLEVNYEPPVIVRRIKGKCTLSETRLLTSVAKAAKAIDGRIVLTGASSTGKYAVMARELIFSFYCGNDPDQVLKELGADFRPDDPFANLEILQTEDARVFFDMQLSDNRPFASPVQTWLELIKGDKRDRETAEQVKAEILDRVKRSLAAGGR